MITFDHNLETLQINLGVNTKQSQDMIDHIRVT